jgi:hypothetical protein
VQHPWAFLFERTVDSVTAALSRQSARQYRATARNFLIYLTEEHPKLRSLDQLRRDPHILGWLTRLRSHSPPLAAITYTNRVLFLRILLQELAVTAKLPELRLFGRVPVCDPFTSLLPTTKAVVSERDQPVGQHGECVSASMADAPPNPDALMLLTVCLPKSSPVADDRGCFTNRTPPR